MTMRVRKLIGVVLTLLWLIVYALVVMAVGGEFVVGRGMVLELAFYVAAGFAWLPVSMMIIRWMSRPDPA